MVDQKRRDTSAELLLRRALHAAGHRYRVNLKVPGAPRRTIDIAFTRPKLAVMVDGCFWHGCPDHCVPPKHNAAWWAEKLRTNRERDADTTELLEGAGWAVLRIWEHVPSAEGAAMVEEALRRLRKPVDRASEPPDRSMEALRPHRSSETPRG